MSCSVTYPSQITPAGVEDCSELDAGARLILHRVLVDIGVTNISEAQLSTPKSLRERSLRVQCSEHDHNAVLGRAHGMADLLYRVPQWQTGMKNVDFFRFFLV